MKHRKLKAKGQRGSWFAVVDGETFPCVHQYWTSHLNGSLVYTDPYCSPDDAKWVAFLAALHEKKRAVLTRDGPPNGEMVFERQGYVALFRIDLIRVENGTLRFQFAERLAELV